ncbi:hypothetical protein FALBO_2308 [Fusarium albosuccineum]|uniref:Uncharacterized protein n=1 Tax=Fusarium albosuccineum TaxID=1237068 RepID=A0A8H4LJL2_9HYPO|nr:hypothetical protein FALBO_2308 [Fusarium albosuccineum]
MRNFKSIAASRLTGGGRNVQQERLNGSKFNVPRAVGPFLQRPHYGFIGETFAGRVLREVTTGGLLRLGRQIHELFFHMHRAPGVPVQAYSAPMRNTSASGGTTLDLSVPDESPRSTIGAHAVRDSIRPSIEVSPAAAISNAADFAFVAPETDDDGRSSRSDTSLPGDYVELPLSHPLSHPHRGARRNNRERDEHIDKLCQVFRSKELWNEAERELDKARAKTNKCREKLAKALEDLAKAKDEERLLEAQHDGKKARYREGMTELDRMFQELKSKCEA